MAKKSFNSFNETFKEMEEELERLKIEAARLGIKTDGPWSKYLHSSSVTVAPKTQKSESVKKDYDTPPFTSEEANPSVEIIERENEVRVITEIHSTNKDQINVKVLGRNVIIEAQTEDGKYFKEVALPTEISSTNVQTTYNNGVLQIILKKRKNN